MTVKPDNTVNVDNLNAEASQQDPMALDRAVKAIHVIPDGCPVTLPLLRFLVGPEGYFFHVRFQKRTANEVRDMTCRFGVRSKLKGGEAAYDFKEKNLLCVYDPTAEDRTKPKLPEGGYPRNGGYRTIPVENLMYFRAHGVAFNIIDGKLFREETPLKVAQGEFVEPGK